MFQGGICKDTTESRCESGCSAGCSWPGKRSQSRRDQEKEGGERERDRERGGGQKTEISKKEDWLGDHPVAAGPICSLNAC